MTKFLVLAVLFITSFSVHAWDYSNFKSEALSPFTTSASNVAILGTSLTLGVLLFEDQIVDPTQKMFTNHKPLGDFSKIGNLGGQLIPNVLYVIGQSIAGALGNENAYYRSVGMFKATAYAMTLTNGIKFAVREPRPVSRSERDSFPSGHSTAAFAFAGYVYEEHGLKWGVPALALASFVGASRINDNRHYLHDVLAGATIGLAYGIGIAKVDRQNDVKSEIGPDFTLIPIFDWNMKGLAFVKEF
jgi:membrane-associated phospholipid phosphatase